MSTIDSSSALSMNDLFATTLSGTISASDTVIGLNAVPTASEGFLVLELGTNTEYIYYNSKTSNTVTCPSVARGRGQGGTTAVGHTTGASVKQVVNSDYWKELQNGNANLGMQTYFNENFTNFVASGCVWTADAAGSTLLASMTAGVVYIAGKRVTVAAVTSRAFTLSKDVYIDVTVTTGNNTGTLVYTDNTLNAASPALAVNSIRIGIITTGATSIAAAASVNQGQPDRVLPIASSVPYAVTDSLGNLICNRNPNPVLLGYRQITTTFTTTATSGTDVTGLSVPVIVPTGRKVKVTAYSGGIKQNGAAATAISWHLFDGATGIANTVINEPGSAYNVTGITEAILSPTAGLHTYKVQVSSNGVAGTYTVAAGDASTDNTFGVAYIKVELV